MWFNRTKGNIGSGMHVAQGSEEDGDPTTLLIGSPDAIPDWVRTPEEIGGQRLKVLGSFQRECPICNGGPPVRHLECSDGFFVAECVSHGFAWYKQRTS
jgi:hypothetical protein